VTRLVLKTQRGFLAPAGIGERNEAITPLCCSSGDYRIHKGLRENDKKRLRRMDGAAVGFLDRPEAVFRQFGTPTSSREVSQSEKVRRIDSTRAARKLLGAVLANSGS
jgi:hypothetical protein